MSFTAQPAEPRRPRWRAAVAALIAIFALGMAAVAPAAAAPATPGPGFTDFVYKPLADGTGADDVTSFRNQSKLWFNDGRWWGILFDKGSTAERHVPDPELQHGHPGLDHGHGGAQVDNRNRSHCRRPVGRHQPVRRLVARARPRT